MEKMEKIKKKIEEKFRKTGKLILFDFILKYAFLD